MIALTEWLSAGRSMVRSVLLVVTVTAAVLVGLLAMHAFNSHTGPETGPSTSLSAAAVTDAGLFAAGTGAVGDHHTAHAAADEPCGDCGAGGHSDMLTMACVLALLATALLLTRPRSPSRWLSVLPRPTLLNARSSRRPVSRPPSLTVLCVSRT